MSLYVSYLDKEIAYTGAELAPHWISGVTGHFGSALVAFRGPCRVKSSEMVDLEDSRRGLFIEAKEMIHFIGEWFEGDLNHAILRQRLFIASFAEELQKELENTSFRIGRSGNDLYVHDRASGGGKKKLSVSIVTASPVSTLLHFGVNLDAGGAPVAAVGLKELGVDGPAFARKLLAKWREESDSIMKARAKVSPR